MDKKLEVLKLHARGVNKSEIARRVNEPRTNIRRWIKEAKSEINCTTDNEETTEWLVERHQLKEKIHKTTKQLNSALKESIVEKAIREHIFKLAEHSPEIPDWIVATDTSNAKLMPVTIWSDWHIGEQVDPAQISGINAYGIDIARERVKTLVDRTIHLCFNHMVTPEYKGIVINLGGDMISGDIHQELVETNEASSIPAVIEAFDLLVWALTEMQKKFGKVFVPCVYGNHGRNVPKPQYKRAAHHNYDWLLYQMLERYFKDRNPNIVIHVASGFDVQYEAYGVKFLLTHGDNIGSRGGDGIIGAIGPITRGDSKMRNLKADTNQNYDVLLMGHYHQYLELSGGSGFVNGSLIGYGEYAISHRFRYQPPMQALFFVDPTLGVTFRTPIYVDTSTDQKSSESVKLIL